MSLAACATQQLQLLTGIAMGHFSNMEAIVETIKLFFIFIDKLCIISKYYFFQVKIFVSV